MSPSIKSQDASESPATPLRPQAALSILTPSLSRATSTSALSVISVESHNASPRRLLTTSTSRARQPLIGISSDSGLVAGLPDDGGSAGSSRAASVLGVPSSTGTGRSTPSRKGKERALELHHGSEDVFGSGADGDAATRSLRRVVREDGGESISHQSSDLVFGSQTESVPDTGQKTTSSQSEGGNAGPAIRTRHTRQYFVLTDAGKPVFISHPELNDHSATDLTGVAQTLISIFAEDDDKIRCINRGRHRIAFILRKPLYFFCVSDWGEPEHILRIHLDYIHLQILSVVTSTQLAKAFQRRSNFDLSRLLEGTENFLHRLIDRAQYDVSFITSTLQPLRMNPVLREAAAASLIPPAKFKDLLYVLLVADGHIVTLLRPKKHSIHPSDLHLLLNMLASSPALRSTETWIPLCLPKFNPAGFVHAYISYVSESLGLVFVSADREAFEDLRAWRATVVKNLEKERTLQKIESSIPQHSYPVSNLGCPGLIHFIYKSRQLVQITMPDWEGSYAVDGQDRRRLITNYHILHDGVHARSGQSAPLKLMYFRTDQEAYLAWVTRPFELYMTLKSDMTKSAAVAAANAVAKWVAVEEGRIFLKDAPVF